MSHIWGKVKWAPAVFRKYDYVEGELILYLDDEAMRKMNDWNEDTLTTLDKLKDLKRGDAISVGTWETYSQETWFCDVKKL